MATMSECETAVAHVATLLHGADDTVRAHAEDRTVSLFVPDLDVVFSGRLHEGHLVDVTTDERDKAQIRLTIASDDLVQLVSGQLAVPHAFASGRVRIDASIRDLLRLRTLL
jgi:alkyl sulfatase BDS1-like metallo-beta-lactamase superfamily hydrolase